jgi:hypothetical protein
VTAVVAANALLWFVSAAAAPVLTLLVIADAPETEWPGRIADLNRFQGFGWADSSSAWSGSGRSRPNSAPR